MRLEANRPWLILAAVGFMIAAAGLVVGFLPVNTNDGGYCGSAIAQKSHLTDTCSAAISDRLPMTWGPIVLGGGLLVVGLAAPQLLGPGYVASVDAESDEPDQD
jgi:hypothetical protein